MLIWLVLEMGHLTSSRNEQWQFLKAGEVQVIWRGGKVWVPEAMVPEILTMYHDDREHFGVKKTVQMIQEKFWIPKITWVVSEYNRKCDTYWRIKAGTRAAQIWRQPTVKD